MKRRVFNKSFSLFLILIVTMVFFLVTSCSFDIFQRLMDKEEEKDTGTLNISVPHLSPLVQSLFKGQSPWSKNLASKAYLVADEVYFDLYKDGYYIESWSVTPGINSSNSEGGPQTVVPEKALEAGNYTIWAYVHNYDGIYNPSVYGHEDFTIYPGENTAVTIMCTPYNYVSLWEYQNSAIWNGFVPWYYDQLTETLDPGSELWFAITVSNNYTNFGVYPYAINSSQSRPVVIVYDSAGYMVSMGQADGDDPGGTPVVATAQTEPNGLYYVAVLETNGDPYVNKDFYVYCEPFYPPVSEKEVPVFNQWFEDSLTNYETIWYYFEAVAGNTYSIYQDDSYLGSGYYSSDIKVSAYRADQQTSYFEDFDDDYNTPATFTASANERVWIKVEEYWAGEYPGSFALFVQGQPYVPTYTVNGSVYLGNLSEYSRNAGNLYVYFTTDSEGSYPVSMVTQYWDTYNDWEIFSVSNLPEGEYFSFAFLDTNFNGSVDRDTEPFEPVGSYGSLSSPASIYVYQDLWDHYIFLEEADGSGTITIE